MLTDSHCHLDFPDFDDDLSQVIARAHAAGVNRMVTICTKRAGLAKVHSIAERLPEVWFAYGIHPMSVASEPMIEVSELVEAAQHPRMVGIGETGLDYHYTAESAEAQQTSLRRHIEACRQTGLPLIIHSRAADDDMAAILREEHASGPFTCVMHCFSSGPELAATALELGFYLSMSGIVTFPKSTELREIFATAPLDRILVETDSPYLAPVPHRGKRNEPAHTAHTAARGAEVFGISAEDFAAHTEANFERLFTRTVAGA
ncbi:TatD family hydrolase [Pontivivens nitratireducens]|uniref:TatD family hydrolase n=1 Tax=Pontivivens nitratireducens TaxID=2758038 RepID=A0A6G7VNU9_9RHOB|nr:TatD family hydrolase [Pontibrevibacter nitratireducens]QIK41528.1 TatD family hydrolase [Pontibrevibacter nitratireducens]